MNDRGTKRINLLPQIVQISCRSGADAVQILCRRVYTPKTIDYQVLCMEKCRVQTFLDLVNASPKSKDATHGSWVMRFIANAGSRSTKEHKNKRYNVCVSRLPREHKNISLHKIHIRPLRGWRPRTIVQVASRDIRAGAVAWLGWPLTREHKNITALAYYHHITILFFGFLPTSYTFWA